MLPNFNALPEPYQPRHISFNKMMAVPAALGAVGILVLLMVIVQNAAARINNVQNQLDNSNYLLEKKQTQKKQMSDNITALQAQINSVEAQYDIYAAAIKELSGTGSNFNKDLTTSVNTIESGISIHTMTIDNATVNINGNADSQENVFTYVRSLTDTGRFQSITINNITLQTQTGSSDNSSESDNSSVTYKITCVLKADRQ